MTSADQPVPAPGSPEASPASADRASGAQSVEPAWRGLTSGTAVVALFCVPVMAVLTVLAVHAAHGHRWGVVAGII